MDRLQKLQLRQSEVRTSLAEMLDTPAEKRSETFDGDLGKLTGEMKSIEVEVRAALVMTPEPEERRESGDAQEREFAAMLETANLGSIFKAAIEHRSADGVEKELQDHFGLASNQIPLEMLRDMETMERRAAATITGDVAVSQSPTIGYIYPRAIAAFLGVSMPTVPVGERTYPVLTTPATVRTPAKSAAAAETTAEFTVKTLVPRRAQASFSYTREDAARFPNMAGALRTNLNAAISDKVDSEVVNGAGGFFGTGGLAAPTAPTVTATFPTYRGLVYGRIDGRYASVASDVRLVVGSETYQKMASTYRGNSDNTDALASLLSVSAGVRVGAHIADPTTNLNDQDLIAALGTAMNAVAPMWQGVSLIVDEVTKAKEGEIIITAVQLMSVAILRADGFARLAVQLGA